jgi:hypothetical protein
MKITKIALFVMLGVLQSVMGSEGDPGTSLVSFKSEKVEFFKLADVNTSLFPTEISKVHVDQNGVTILVGKEQGITFSLDTVQKSIRSSEFEFIPGCVYIYTVQGHQAIRKTTEWTQDNVDKIKEELNKRAAGKGKEKEKIKSSKTIVLGAALAQHQDKNKKADEETSQTGKKITRFHTMVTTKKYDNPRMLVIQEIKEDRRLCLKDEATGLSIVLNNTHVNQLQELYKNRGSQASQEQWFCTFSDNTKVLIKDDYSALDEMFKKRDTTRVSDAKESEDISHPGTQITKFEAVVLSDLTGYEDKQRILIVIEQVEQQRFALKDETSGEIIYLNHDHINQITAERANLTARDGNISLLCSLSDGSEVLVIYDLLVLNKMNSATALKAKEENSTIFGSYKNYTINNVTVEDKSDHKPHYTNCTLHINKKDNTAIIKISEVSNSSKLLSFSAGYSEVCEQISLDPAVIKSIEGQIRRGEYLLLIAIPPKGKNNEVFHINKVTENEQDSIRTRLSLVPQEFQSITISSIGKTFKDYEVYCKLPVNQGIIPPYGFQGVLYIDKSINHDNAIFVGKKLQKITYAGTGTKEICPVGVDIVERFTLTEDNIKTINEHINSQDDRFLPLIFGHPMSTDLKDSTMMNIVKVDDKPVGLSKAPTSASWLKSTKWIGGGIATAAFLFSILYYMYKNGVSFGDVASELTKMVKFKA